MLVYGATGRAGRLVAERALLEGSASEEAEILVPATASNSSKTRSLPSSKRGKPLHSSLLRKLLNARIAEAERNI
jgi:hypothetical protein